MNTTRPLFLNARINPAGGLQSRVLADAPRQSSVLFSVEHWVGRAEVARAGLFAAVFLADQPRLQLDEGHLPEYTLDPLILATAITQRVPDISVVATASANYNLPYVLARQFASANLLSGGRIAWNAVASLDPGVAANFGGPVIEHERRYERAAEFLHLVQELFESWRYPWDERTGQGWGSTDPVNWNGEFFSVTGPLNVPLARFGPPVQVQAGGSPSGLDLAGRFAEVVYAIAHEKSFAVEYRTRLHHLARSYGRDPSTVLLAPLVNPIVVSTESEKQSVLEDHLIASGTLDQQIERLSDQIGYRLEGIDMNTPLSLDSLQRTDPDRPVPLGIARSLQELVRHTRPTLTDLLARSTSTIVDTPEAIATHLTTWWRGGAADGFTVNTLFGTTDLENFTAEVVPLLQAEGAYRYEYESAGLRANLGLT